jgi:putative Holliday junction resolvase
VSHAGPGVGRVLGLDLGSRRIGVAVSDADRRMATGMDVIIRSGSPEIDHRRIRQLVDETEAACVVVGLPMSLSGSLGPAARAVLDEVGGLSRTLPVPVETFDERMTTVVAHRSLASAGRDSRRRRHVVDQVAAAAILESWLARERQRGADK